MPRQLFYVLGVALFALHGGALAQSTSKGPAPAWPAKPLRATVAFTAGSATDIIARTLGERLWAQLGQPVVIENRPGASGTIGAAIVARAEPDGYTMLVNSSSHTVAPSTYASLPYDTVRDLAGITPLANLPSVLVIAPSRGIRSVRDLVTAARARPGAMSFASGGAGSAAQLNAERFRMSAGFDAVHVPYKGAPEALADIIGGRVDFYFCPIVPALPLVKDGKLLAIAVGSAKRATALPDVPTTIEAGFPNSEYNFWVGLFAPGKTPRPLVKRLYQETQKALSSPEMSQRMRTLGAEPMPMTPEQFDAYVRDEIALNAKLVKAAGIRPQ
jgi:tripartite-type tricarboxylate transporter receptor subunit TctC